MKYRDGRMKDEIKKIFICGPIDSTSRYRSRTMDAEMKLRWKGDSGYVFNPAEVLHAMPSVLTKATFTVIERAMLKECNAIYMLKGWKESPQAVAYLKYAKRKEYEINYEGREDAYSYLCGNDYTVERRDEQGNVHFNFRRRKYEFKGEDHGARGSEET